MSKIGAVQVRERLRRVEVVNSVCGLTMVSRLTARGNHDASAIRARSGAFEQLARILHGENPHRRCCSA
jgi:hypothetical protein